MTNNEAMNAYTELQNISSCTGVLGWYVYKNLKVLDDATMPYRKAHDDLIRKYGGGESTPVPKENTPALMAELNQLMMLEIDVRMTKMDRNIFERLIKEDKSLSAETMFIIDRNIVEDPLPDGYPVVNGGPLGNTAMR